MNRLMRTTLMAGLVLGLGITSCSDQGTLDEPLAPADTDMIIAGPGEVNLVDFDDVTFNGARWISGLTFKVGTGVINPFLSVQASPDEEGFNTDGSFNFDQTRPNFTDALALNTVPVIKRDGVDYREVILDANEANSGIAALFSIDIFDLWLCNDAGAPGFEDYGEFEGNGDCALVYDLGGEIGLATDGKTNGSGNSLDYLILIPEADFQTALAALGATSSCPYNPDAAACGIWVILKTQMGAKGGDYVTGSTFEEFSTIIRPYVTIEKTAVTSLTRTHDWDIEKSVDIPLHVMFPGQEGTSEYTVDVTYNGYTDSNWAVQGEITVTNPTNDDVMIAGVSDVISGGGEADIPQTVSCGETFPFLLAGGGTLLCTYSQSLSNGNDRLNTASVEIVDGAVSEATADIDFSTATVTDVDKLVNITDTYAGALGSLDGQSGQFTYQRSWTCDADEGEYPNTATIVETGQSDNANVEVVCEALTVTKTADTYLTRTYEWSIDKSADQTSLLLSEGQLFQVNYSVTVDVVGFTDSDWKVMGSITVHNGASIAAELTGVTDMVSGVGAATVDCGVAFPYILAAGGDLICSYMADLPDGTNRTNTATATIDGGATFDSPGVPVDFSSPTITEVDECVDVTDTNVGFLGQVCVDAAPTTFNYSLWFGAHPDADVILECGENSHPNLATATTIDQLIELTDNWTVDATVECVEGCTLTQGYWKTHNDSFHGGAPTDDTWALLPSGENTVFFLSGQTYFEVMWTAPKGNAYYNLAHQYIAAVLNVLNGAGAPPEVLAAINDATTLFNTYTPAQIGALKGKQAPRPDFISLAGTLAAFNEGEIGPGHCDEDANSAS